MQYKGGVNMFGNKKTLHQIEESKKQLEETKEQLKIEKQELLFIKDQLENTTPKVDISNMYVWKDKNLCSIVRLDIQKIHGRSFGGVGPKTDGYLSTLIDIFTNNILYQKSSIKKINTKQFIPGETLYEGYYAYLIPLHEVDKNILAFANKKVPLYVLQQLYYKLNNVDINAYVLKKEK